MFTCVWCSANGCFMGVSSSVAYSVGQIIKNEISGFIYIIWKVKIQKYKFLSIIFCLKKFT